MTLREELIAMARSTVVPSPGQLELLAISAARVALTRYAESMERAGQPAAGFGATVMAMQLSSRAG